MNKKKALIARIVALGICSTPLLAHAYIKQLSNAQLNNLTQQLEGSKIKKAAFAAADTQ